ncbi:bifunctional 3-phenylpropionate/cinnamic acid dioxygenase ferredoxin subunit [Mycobacterium sp.]|uniref:bifunctional 3-phenylpropionate/cinnamic acid dioxygenase ferredoxin subunit n=1 Tax=Mycobacterium sp. TaxID=1785 RepID=UPI00127E8977|nr:bifunctional 3-phenylpropionate/cinnamic acid dioxygenase ferredoxin subunit [Mycobacterium sp.]KAA8946767.1 MAG: bifunctional 3-phenylpropionate/cinnamic acid dioxygenase ferredoxin subunit [Mycobacterium sp.]
MGTGDANAHDVVLVEVGPLADLSPGHACRVETPAGPVAVFNVDGELLAIADKCTHADASLSEGYLEGHLVECPLHGSQFDLRTGEPQNFPAYAAVRCFPVHVREGIVLVEV